MKFIVAIFLGLLFVSPLSAFFQKERSPVKRVKRPVFSQDDKEMFFENIFKDGLVGDRPKNVGQSPQSVAGSNSKGSPETTSGDSSDSYSWSSIVNSSAIEDEIKAIKINLDKTITTPTKFNSGGFKASRVNYSVLAMCFAIIAEYDKEIRFKKYALGARDAFARCAANSSTSTPQSYKQAKERKQDLQDLLGGGTVNFGNSPEAKTDWSNVCDRSPLMERLELAIRERLKPFTSSDSEFKGNIDEIAHEASMVAAIAEVLTREGMEDSIEEDYSAHAITMKQGALAILSAVQSENYDDASKGVGIITQSCDSCHEDWQ